MSSPQNALVKRAASLRQRKFRDREGAFLVEGADVVAAALAAGRRPQTVFLREDVAGELGARLGLADASARLRLADAGAHKDAGAAGSAAGRPADAGAAGPEAAGPSPGVFVVSERVMARISTLEAPADVVAVVPLPERRPLASLLRLAGEAAGAAAPAAGPLVVYADGIQDPGNVGTLIRAAVAFGAAAVVTSAGSADPYGPKAVRAGMGALFGLPVFPGLSPADIVAQLPGAAVYGLAAHGGEPLDAAELRRPAVLIVGAERAGLSPAAAAHVERLLTIPLAPGAAGAVESLNAGAAAAIALYEFSRRPAGAPRDPSRRPAAQEG